MNITPLPHPEVLLLEPKVLRDKRGFLVETSRASILTDAGIPALVQHNQCRSRQGVLRGLHYQLAQPQGTLVHCTRGAVFDVAVDVRRGSPRFSQWIGVVLDDVSHHQLWIPPGFAHGFLVLSRVADVCCQCSDYDHPESEQGIRWDDPDLEIDWPELAVAPQLSVEDSLLPTLAGQNSAALPLYGCDSIVKRGG